ncbi:MAG: hypothetical protein HQL46_06570 [Gammaproteobacteria bacterium]|nr:hypothetical protein [Gammaproteobacteria bacterium]
MQKLLNIFFNPNYYKYVLVFRLFTGVIIIASAPASGSPFFMNIMGAIIFFVALVNPLLPDEKLIEMEQWWLALSWWQLKIWSLVWSGVWFIIAYMALPRDAYYAVPIFEYLDQFI